MINLLWDWAASVLSFEAISVGKCLGMVLKMVC
jgi:hypothetical protein